MCWIGSRASGTGFNFEDSQYGGYSLAELERLLGECSFLSLAERPGLLRTGLNWFLEAGEPPVATA